LVKAGIFWPAEAADAAGPAPRPALPPGPTLSAGLYVQMAGRGMRVKSHTDHCMVLDFAGNCLRHGPLDAIRPPGRGPGEGRQQAAPQRVCGTCQTIAPTAALVCPGCGVEFPPPPPAKLFPGATGAPALSIEPRAAQWQPVTSVEYRRHEPRDPNKRPTLRVDYCYHYRPIGSEWLCVEHEGFARRKAEDWWARRHPDTPLPATIDDALALTPDLATPLEIALTPDGKYERVTDWRFTKKSSLPTACWTCAHWTGTTCSYWNDTPPADVQSRGCEAWSDDDPMPF
jgi:DNA repair protein RadD